jgi:predicted CopG family antitoxin
METMTIRVRPHTYRMLQDLAREHDESLSDALDRLVEEHRRCQIMEQAHQAYAAVAAHPVAAALWQEEIAAWNGTLADGLEALPDTRGNW